MKTFRDLRDNLQIIHDRLPIFRAYWMRFRDFETHLDYFGKYISAYEEILLMGNFSNTFHRKAIQECGDFYSCDFRVLSIDPRGDKSNIYALRKMEEDGAKVRIHKTLHARMFIGYNKENKNMLLVVGTYDYNREGLSGENVNVGISCRDPDLVEKARDFFMEQWESPDTLSIDDYFENLKK